VTVEYAGSGGIGPLRSLAQAAGLDLDYVIELANTDELHKIFEGGRTYRIDTEPAPDSPLLRLLLEKKSGAA
jgi:hypothetical protein